MKQEFKYGLYISIGCITLITLEVAYKYYKLSTIRRPPHNGPTDTNEAEGRSATSGLRKPTEVG